MSKGGCCSSICVYSGEYWNFCTYYKHVMGEPLDGRKLPRAKKEFVDAGAGNGNY